MCGIAGIVTRDPREAEAALARMVPTMIHRGPDDGGHEIRPLLQGNEHAVVGLGFRRLAILDLSPTGHQPMCDAESGNVLVFNGEIYNFAELRTELRAEGCHFRGTSDTEVLLHLLGRRGEQALARLEGMFALAFYRARDQALLLARDQLGIKPLYVARQSGRLIFASEIRTLLASTLVPREIDVDGVAGMLAFGAVQGPRTVFSAVEEFPAGHFQWNGGPVTRYWRFPAVTTFVEGDPAATTRQLVQNAVRRHLVADVPVGVFLSAGIDSTIVAACAAESAASITSFTVGIGPRHPEDETAVAAATAERLGLRHEVVGIDEKTLPSLWRDWIGALDSPSIDGFNTYLVAKGLADRAIKVGLSGLGADEFFGGYPVFRNAPRLRRLMTALSFLPPAVVARVAESVLAGMGRPAAGEKLAAVLRGGRDIEAIAIGLRRVSPDRLLRSLGMPRPETLDASESRNGPVVPPGDDFNVVSRVEASCYMRATLLRDSDANSMRHSLELRVPFLDRPLVEHTLALPGAVKAGPDGVGKHLLRTAFGDRLPDAVTRRPKTGFTLPVSDWMRREMRSYCEESIAALAAFSWMEGAAVRRTWAAFLTDPRSTPWSRAFALVVLGDYLNRHAG